MPIRVDKLKSGNISESEKTISPTSISHIAVCALALFLVSFLLYFNTISNGYALDDGIVISDNPLVKKGFNGIWDLFSSDTFKGVSGAEGELTGGRYRPLALFTYAIEVGIFGLNPLVSHLVNILLYSLLIVVVFFFLLNCVFKKDILPSFLSALMFSVHPVHSEVVANIKGRDEILVLLFSVAAMMLILQYFTNRKLHYLILASLLFFFALLSKENAIIFTFVIGLIVWFGYRYSGEERVVNSGFQVRDILYASSFLLLPVFLYLGIRYQIVGFSQSQSKELMNSPFLLASGTEAFATKIYILLKYLKYLIYPHPLSFDYSYNAIPYLNFKDIKVWMSIVLNLMLVAAGIWLFMKNNIASIGIFIYFISLLLVSNFVFEVGSPFNERFLFIPSLGFVIVLGAIFQHLFSIGELKNLNFIKIGIYGLTSVVFIVSSVRVYSRNQDWKNNETLFRADAIAMPQSAKTNVYYGVALVYKLLNNKSLNNRSEVVETAKKHFLKGLDIYPDFTDAHINLGLVFALNDEPDSAAFYWEKASILQPRNKVLQKNKLYYAVEYEKSAMQYLRENKPALARQAFYHSLGFKPENAEVMHNIGGTFVMENRLDSARAAWNRTLGLYPDHESTIQWLERIKK